MIEYIRKDELIKAVKDRIDLWKNTYGFERGLIVGCYEILSLIENMPVVCEVDPNEECKK